MKTTFIKLTDRNTTDRTPVYLNVNHIVALHKGDDFTIVALTIGEDIEVIEPAGEIFSLIWSAGEFDRISEAQS